ncbi:MAG: hypothetical protein K2R98_31820 [Gemmataceae bacterium]|nr:hypothetical protein [Gemmataceae bacterium]
MRAYFRAWVLAPLALMLVGAAPELTPEDYVRQGNAAFEQGQYDAAVKLYTQAEERITNPGLVAYNKGAALYRLGDFRAAEVHYRRCLEDASGEPRAAMLYDLGNCLLQQSQGSNAELLRDAMKCYLLCLREDGLGDELKTNARHNLELAKLLWIKAKNAQPNKDPGKNPDDPKETPPEPKKQPDEPKNNGNDTNPGTDPTPKVTPQPDPSNPNQTPTPTREPPPPGSGNLPPIPDKDELTRMLPEDAAAHLARAAERILRERKEHQQKLAPAPSRVMPDY